MMRSSEPFSIDDVVATRTLAVALDRLVLNHPRIVKLRADARGVAASANFHPFDDYAGMIWPVYGHDEQMLALKHFAPKDYEPLSDEEEYNILAKSDTPIARAILKRGRRPREVERFYREIKRYAQALFDVLTNGHVDAWCDNAISRQYERISSAAWIRDEFYVLPNKGDVFEATGNLFEGNARMELRWRAIELRATAQPAAVTVRTSSATTEPAVTRRAPKRDIVKRAILKLDLSPIQIGELGASQIYGLIHPDVGSHYPNTASGADALRTEIKRVIRELKKKRPAVVTLVPRRLREK